MIRDKINTLISAVGKTDNIPAWLQELFNCYRLSKKTKLELSRLAILHRNKQQEIHSLTEQMKNPQLIIENQTKLEIAHLEHHVIVVLFECTLKAAIPELLRLGQLATIVNHFTEDSGCNCAIHKQIAQEAGMPV